MRPDIAKLQGKGTMLPALSGGWNALGLLKGLKGTVRDVIEECASLL